MLTNNAEGGTDGITVTAGNSGGASGDAFATVVTSGDAIFTYSNAHAAHGSLGYQIATRATSLQNYAGWDNGAALTDGYGRFYFYLDVMPMTASPQLIQVRATSGGSIGGYVTLSSAASHLSIRHGDNSAAVWTGTYTLLVATSYRLEWRFVPGNPSGTIQVRLYLGDSTTALEDSGAQTVTSSGAMTTFQYLRIGIPNAVANVPSTGGSVFVDDLVAFATNWPGPLAGPTAADTPFPPLGRGATW